MMLINETVATLKENICASCGYDCSSNMDICDISYCDNKEAIRIIEKVLHDVQLVGDCDCISRHDVLDMIQNLTRWPIKEFGKYTKVGVIYNDAIHAVNSVIPVYKKFDGLDQQKWTPVSEDSLPDEKWVLGYINNIHDGIGAPHMCVVKIKKGISKKERARLEKLKDPRAHVFYYYDEWGNNLVPYAWDTWGPGGYFGQEVIAWCELPEPYKADEEVEE